MPKIFQTRGFSILMVVVAAVLFALGLLNLVINTRGPGSWAPLLVLMPLPFFLGLRRLRGLEPPSSRS